MVRVRVSPAFYMAQLRDIAEFKTHEAVLQIGVFGIPATPSDVRALTLPADTAKALRHCRPRDGEVQRHRKTRAIHAIARLPNPLETATRSS